MEVEKKQIFFPLYFHAHHIRKPLASPKEERSFDKWKNTFRCVETSV